MKHYVLILFIFLFGSMSFANPFYVEGKNTVRDKDVYLYNINLWKKLNADYDKRCWVETPTSYNNICKMGSYQREVVDQYYRTKKEY